MYNTTTQKEEKNQNKTSRNDRKEDHTKPKRVCVESYYASRSSKSFRRSFATFSPNSVLR
jgi:hypothetical protein